MAIAHQNWPDIPARTPTSRTNSSTADQLSVDQQPISDRFTIVDRLFSQLANAMNDLDDAV
jgi:hypothetical protein